MATLGRVLSKLNRSTAATITALAIALAFGTDYLIRLFPVRPYVPTVVTECPQPAAGYVSIAIAARDADGWKVTCTSARGRTPI